MRRLTAYLLALFVCSAILGADSLVPSDFPGYLSAAGSLQVGDLVSVQISSETSMVYTSSFSNSGSVSLTFTGGEGNGLFDFLPGSDTLGQSNAGGEEESSLSTKIAARIVQTGSSGTFFLRGSRETRIDRAVQRIELEGWAEIRDLDENGTIAFDDLADSVLVFSSFSNGEAQIISDADLMRPGEPSIDSAAEAGIDSEPQTLPRIGEILPEDQNGTPEESISEESVPSGNAYSINEDTRRRLLLEYINRMINLLFTPAE